VSSRAACWRWFCWSAWGSLALGSTPESLVCCPAEPVTVVLVVAVSDSAPGFADFAAAAAGVEAAGGGVVDGGRLIKGSGSWGV